MKFIRHITQYPRWIACFLVAVSDISVSANGPFAKIHNVPEGEAQWTNGFWAERWANLRDVMFPVMQEIMEGSDRSQYFRNFQIAADQAEGRSRGAPFNDGDFYKWLQAACHILSIEKDQELEAYLDQLIATIAKAQRPDGYLHTPVIIDAKQGDVSAVPFSNRHNFELYNMGHLFTTASIHHRVTGKTNLLNVAQKAADFLDVTFKEAPPEAARSSVCPSHYMGMVDLWRVTHEDRYLELARKFFHFRSLIEDGGDDNQDRIPFEQQTEAVGHAVRANYLYAGAADLYMETGESSFWNPLPKLWENVVQKKMYITGGCGALYDGASPDGSKQQRSITRTHQAYGRNYQLPNVTAHNETCANIGNVLWNWRMFLSTGEARYVDVLELTLYNSVLSGVDLEGENYFYTNPLRVTHPLPNPLRWSRTRVPYVSAFCCPPNVVRTLAATPNFAFAKSSDAVWINLYGGSELKTKIKEEKLQLKVETHYPWEETVVINVDELSVESLLFDLHLRIPSWADGAKVVVSSVDGVRVKKHPNAGSYLRVRRDWKQGDRIELQFPMPALLMESHPLVEESRNHLAIKRGPMVYCLESTDLPDQISIHDVYLAPNKKWMPRFDPNLLNGVVALEGVLHLRSDTRWDGELYRPFQESTTRELKAKLIPYAFWGNRGISEMSVWLPLRY